MVYGDEKIREMSRSILPSKKRKAAKFGKRAAKQAHRRQSHKDVAGIVACEERFDSSPDLFSDSNVRESVMMRRYADKEAPLMRWAKVVTRQLRPIDRLAHIKAILPNSSGVVGLHAGQHIAFMEEMKDPTAPRRPSWQEARRARAKAESRALLHIARTLLQRPWLEASANRALRAATDWIHVDERTANSIRWEGELPYFRQGMDLVKWRDRLLAPSAYFAGTEVRPEHLWLAAVKWIGEKLKNENLDAFPAFQATGTDPR